MGEKINLTLRIWRQKNAQATGEFKTYEMKDVDTDISFLEMLDILNERLELNGEEPIAFDSDCREGICGTCGAMVNGAAHGPERSTTLCQLHMRHFKDGDTIVVEPWRSEAFPVIKDLVVNRSALDRIIAAGGYISVRTGSAPEAHSVLVPKENADRAFDSAACISCGACVAACPNGSAMLFAGAKISHLGVLPQGQPERMRRVRSMVAQMDAEGFGNCSNYYYCEAACPKDISVRNIARMNRDYWMSLVKYRRKEKQTNGQ
jgi:succinate dehydrogenase / fumarate reductase iron-sulfur subunit